MRVKIRNQIRLKNPLVGKDYRGKCDKVLRILVPDYYKDNKDIFNGILYKGDFDDRSYKVHTGIMGKNLYKIKEIVPGLWMVRSSEKGVCYIKEHWFVGNTEPFHVE